MRFDALLAISCIVLAGCISTSDRPPAETDTPTQSAGSATPASNATSMAQADLPAGRFFKYRAAGTWDVETEYAVVVAKTVDGVLLAGKEKAQLTSVLTWGRPWYGARDGSLNGLGTGGKPGFHYFDFPLEDGKTWPTEADGVNVTARRASIKTPTGPEAGFVISGSSGTEHFSYDYAASVGYFVHYTWGLGAANMYDLTLESVSTSDHWTWFERLGNHAYASWPVAADSQPTSTLHVPSGADVVSAIGYGDTTTHGTLVPPGDPTPAWQFDGRGCCKERSSWIAIQMPAKVGDWQLAVAGAPQSYVGLEATAARWVTG